MESMRLANRVCDLLGGSWEWLGGQRLQFWGPGGSWLVDRAALEAFARAVEDDAEPGAVEGVFPV